MPTVQRSTVPQSQELFCSQQQYQNSTFTSNLKKQKNTSHETEMAKTTSCVVAVSCHAVT
eukprot:735619-Amphidinium_carterae.1